MDKLASQSEEGDLLINKQVRIPRTELLYRFARAKGPGGQHVNKNEIAVELLFDLEHTSSLTEEERAQVKQRLASRLDSTGMLHLESQTERSQLRNRLDVTQRFIRLLRTALQPTKHRRPTRPTRNAIETRLKHKTRASRLKRLRQRRHHED